MLHLCLPSVSLPDVWLPLPGATATHWAPPTANATSELGSASASLALPASIVTDARSTTLALAPKAVNVSLRGWSEADGKDVAQPALPLLFSCLWEGTFTPHFSSQRKLALLCPHPAW